MLPGLPCPAKINQKCYNILYVMSAEQKLFINYVPPEVALPLEQGGTPQYQPEMERWLRYFPNNNTPMHELPIGALAGLTAEQALQVAFEHYEKLDDLGIAVPSAEHYLIQAPEPEQSRVYSAVEHIQGTPATELLETEAGRVQLRGLAQKLSNFIDWACTQPYYLWDAAPLGQYMLRHEPGAPLETGTFVYQDLDALVSSVHDFGAEGSTADLQRGFMNEWADRL